MAREKSLRAILNSPDYWVAWHLIEHAPAYPVWAVPPVTRLPGGARAVVPTILSIGPRKDLHRRREGPRRSSFI
jgi:hypothetical protein